MIKKTKAVPKNKVHQKAMETKSQRKKRKKVDQAAVALQQVILNLRTKRKLRSKNLRVHHHLLQVVLDRAIRIKVKRKNQHRRKSQVGLVVRKRVGRQIRRRIKVLVALVQVEHHQVQMVSVLLPPQVHPVLPKKKYVGIENKNIFLVSVAASKRTTTKMMNFF